MERRTFEGKRSIFTIGHSNHSLEDFIALLEKNQIEVLVDTRSYPRSKFAPYFNMDCLKEAVVSERIRYLFLGKELGGRPKENEFYDATGRVDYARVATSPAFRDGISRIEKGIDQYRLALLCSEENPVHCHRRLLIGRVLANRGITINHIRGNGTVQVEEAREVEDDQPSLFGTREVAEWKSIRPVLRRRPLPNSSTL